MPQAWGQSDSSLLLQPELLQDSDVRIYDLQQFTGKVSTATLVEEDPMDLPFTTWVITAEEIARYGFITLADVLKAAPGIRVSQPGNVTEGETFMMMGLSGNQYVKILLNGVPIKPVMALGVPLAAQLPVRQAERIELIYGASGGFLYGNEACAGVVNIIIKESERPVYTQADLVFGSLGFNSLDLTLGGKLFKGKNITKFSLYGSSTVRSNTDLFWNNGVLDVANYVPMGFSAVDLNAFSNIQIDPSGDLARIAPAQQESRMFGAQVTWKGLRFEYHRMNRSDAAFLGYSPLAISYTNLGNSYRDRIETYLLQYNRRSERTQFSMAISAENYQVDNTSSVRYGFDRVRQFRYFALRADTLSAPARFLFLQREDSLFSAGQRFMTSQSLDLRLDVRFRWQMADRLSWDAGASFLASSGIPLTGYFNSPPELGPSGPVQGPFAAEIQVNGTVQLYNGLDWQGKRFRLLAGVAAGPLLGDGNALIESAVQLGYAPRLAMSYKIDSVQRVYANYARSYKGLQEAQAALSYTYDQNRLLFGRGAAFQRQTERFESAFIGYRFRKSELVGFWQQGFNLLRDGYLIRPSDALVVGGYQYSGGKSQQLWGVQLRLVFEKSTQKVLREGKTQQQVLWRAEYFLQRTEGKEYFGFNIPASNEVRNFPTWMSQLKMSGRTGRVQLAVLMNQQGSALNLGAPFIESWGRASLPSRIPRFSTWDIQVRFFVNKHFLLYLNAQNLFNQAAYGIGVSGGPEDQLLPLQQGRLWRFGVNYNMN